MWCWLLWPPPEPGYRGRSQLEAASHAASTRSGDRGPAEVGGGARGPTIMGAHGTRVEGPPGRVDWEHRPSWSYTRQVPSGLVELPFILWVHKRCLLQTQPYLFYFSLCAMPAGKTLSPNCCTSRKVPETLPVKPHVLLMSILPQPLVVSGVKQSLCFLHFSLSLQFFPPESLLCVQ